MSRLFSSHKTALRAVVRDVSRSQNPTFTRSFSSLPLLRPSLFPSSSPTTTSSVFRTRPTTTTTTSLLAATTTTTETTTIDVVPKTSITAHPALCGPGAQIRCGPRRHMNMNRPSRLIRQRRSGFLNRQRSRTGRKILARRLAKGRKRLSA